MMLKDFEREQLLQKGRFGNFFNLVFLCHLDF